MTGKAQPAIDDYNQWELMPLHGETCAHSVADWFDRHHKSIVDSLTLMAALEAAPEGYETVLWRDVVWCCTINTHKYSGVTATGKTPTEAIQNALSKLTDNGEKE